KASAEATSLVPEKVSWRSIGGIAALALRILRRREKLDQRLGGRLRRLLRQIMPAINGKTAHVGRPFPPGRQRACGLGRNSTTAAPDRQHRTGDFRPGGTRLLVVRQIRGAAGAVVLAGGVDAQRIVKEGVVVRERARIERGEALDLGAGRGARVEEVARIL